MPRGLEIALGLGLVAAALALAIGGAGLPVESRRLMHLMGAGAWIAGILAVWCLAGPRGRHWAGRIAAPAVFARLARIGRTSLACFVASAPIALLTGMLLDATGGGMALSFGAAAIAFVALDRVAAYFDKAPKRAAEAAALGGVVSKPG